MRAYFRHRITTVEIRFWYIYIYYMYTNYIIKYTFVCSMQPRERYTSCFCRRTEIRKNLLFFPVFNKSVYYYKLYYEVVFMSCRPTRVPHTARAYYTCYYVFVFGRVVQKPCGCKYNNVALVCGSGMWSLCRRWARVFPAFGYTLFFRDESS